MKLLTELIQDFAKRIHIGGDVVLRLMDDKGRWFRVDMDAATFNGMDPDDATGKMVAVLPIVFTPDDKLAEHKEAGQ